MFVVITKNGEPVEAFYTPNHEGYLELDQDNLVAKSFMSQLEARA
jgi:hypothetical protein